MRDADILMELRAWRDEFARLRSSCDGRVAARIGWDGRRPGRAARATTARGRATGGDDRASRVDPGDPPAGGPSSFSVREREVFRPASARQPARPGRSSRAFVPDAVAVTADRIARLRTGVRLRA